ncbi:MAG: family 78 glycoside hydrolase catalytic domain [Bryobacteraceae bacterium]
MRSSRSVTGFHVDTMGLRRVVIPLLFLTAALSLVFGQSLASSSEATIYPVSLLCADQEDPLAASHSELDLSWKLRAADASMRGLVQTAYQVLVSSSEEELAAGRGNLWNTEKVTSSGTRNIAYAGQPLVPGATYWWKVRVWDGHGVASPWSRPSRWTVALRPEDWHAKWIAKQPDGAEPEQAMPVFRHAFPVERTVKRALLSISGLGQYEARLNGVKAGDSVLAPGWTNYRKTVFYNTYDVTGLLKPGENVLGVVLGNGMYHVVKTPGRYTKFTGSFGQPKLIAQLHIEFQDGSSFEVASGNTWKTTSGPIVYSSTFGGEDFDARLDPPGWDKPGFDDAKWTAVREVNGPGGTLAPQLNPDIKVMKVYQPVKVTEPRHGVLVYDLGQNFSGWPQIKVRGPAGATVRIFPGELLDKHGLVTQKSAGSNERTGNQWFSYTLRGTAEEVWCPRFSYYGFRYVQIDGASTKRAPAAGKPLVLSLEGQFLYSSAPVVGEFSCSDVLFNRIHNLINAAIRSNMQSVLTDCPHREKLGWLEESHLLGSAIMYNYGALRLYRKISSDMRDSQTPEGLVPSISPEYAVFKRGFRDSPEWGSAVVLNPFLVYQHYADRRMLVEHYDVMRRYVEYLGSKADGHILSYGLGDWYDIGPKPPGVAQLTSLDLTATSIYYADIMALRLAARMLGKSADEQRWDALGREVSDALHAKLYDPKTGIYDRGSQTAYAMPLVIGLVAEQNRKAVLDKLVRNIRRNGSNVTAGDIGFHYVVRALGDGGQSGVLYDMLSRTNRPGYGYQLKKGATALAESWDANPGGSQNHFMLGHAEEWFYRFLAGLDLDFSRPRDEQIRIRPSLAGKISEARARHDSVFGGISSRWTLRDGFIQLEVAVPPNRTATVYVPASGPDSVTESGGPASKSNGVTFVSQGDRESVFRVGSGLYSFRARI